MPENKNNEKTMPIIGHLRELRRSFFVSLIAFMIACIISFIFSKNIISLFTRHFNEVSSVVDKTLVVTSIAEGFLAQLKITVIAGLILSLPVHIFEIIKFLFPALTRRERVIVMSFLFFSLGLITAGAYLAYFKIIPLMVSFLSSPRFLPEGVGFMLSYQANIFYLFMFIIWSILALQMPLVMEILLMLNVLNRKQVFRASRFIIVGVFILAAIITPPDFISQLGVALPLVFFYFLAVFIAKIFKFGEG
ncbi:MAG: twin-arginine translocase subunit TatC [Treponemataceae bacterium]|nr:MAG: twin-arginine translocase subunit TatC [Treponemataceae bacterium]